ncbi:SAM-dependent methyltransferase [Amycolatopsis anabasis]|uniref:SAM-dependent methyltransferase n=1 Tax=Amycolatopsis anabasis TaxID=1840409 RepID=UPI00131AF3F0|nr:SAM-dependent methyltransferase [Amycolatopsis anabasis]
MSTNLRGERAANGAVALPSAARMRDYLLGDGHNLEVDRHLADDLESVVPDIRRVCQLHRTFLRGAMLFLLRSGIRQFLDVGSSLPTVGNARQIALRADAGCRVVQVDRSAFQLGEGAVVIRAGVGDVEDVFTHPATERLLDPREPLGLLLDDVLHFIPDSGEPAAILIDYRRRLAPGSYLVLTHVTADHRPEQTDAWVKVMARSQNQLHPRTRAEVLRLLAGFDLEGPGVADLTEWITERRLDPVERSAATAVYGAIGRKP